MFTARKKIAKEKGQEPDSFEESVAQVLLTSAALIRYLWQGQRLVSPFKRQLLHTVTNLPVQPEQPATAHVTNTSSSKQTCVTVSTHNHSILRSQKASVSDRRTRVALAIGQCIQAAEQLVLCAFRRSSTWRPPTRTSRQT